MVYWKHNNLWSRTHASLYMAAGALLVGNIRAEERSIMLGATADSTYMASDGNNFEPEHLWDANFKSVAHSTREHLDTFPKDGTVEFAF